MRLREGSVTKRRRRRGGGEELLSAQLTADGDFPSSEKFFYFPSPLKEKNKRPRLREIAPKIS